MLGSLTVVTTPPGPAHWQPPRPGAGPRPHQEAGRKAGGAGELGPLSLPAAFASSCCRPTSGPRTPLTMVALIQLPPPHAGAPLPWGVLSSAHVSPGPGCYPHSSPHSRAQLCWFRRDASWDGRRVGCLGRKLTTEKQALVLRYLAGLCF